MLTMKLDGFTLKANTDIDGTYYLVGYANISGTLTEIRIPLDNVVFNGDSPSFAELTLTNLGDYTNPVLRFNGGLSGVSSSSGARIDFIATNAGSTVPCVSITHPSYVSVLSVYGIACVNGLSLNQYSVSDVSLMKSATETAEINNGTLGNFVDLIVRDLTAIGLLKSETDILFSSGQGRISRSSGYGGIYFDSGLDLLMNHHPSGNIGRLVCKGPVVVENSFCFGQSTVATLPDPTLNANKIWEVSDSLAPTLGSTVSAGGTADCLVRSDGTNWKVIIVY